MSVKYVIDGDTIIVGRDEHVRYIGIDTPEQGEEFFTEARELNKALLKFGRVLIVECKGEKKDRYGRTLAWVYAGGRFINGELLSAGLARLLIIPPCGFEKRALLESLAWQARSMGKGIWRGKSVAGKPLIVPPEEAALHIGEKVTIKGHVRTVRESGRAIFVEFGLSRGPGFQAVIFRENISVFKEAGMDPLRFFGSIISVTGVVRRYKGKVEIILADPGQVRLGTAFEAP